MTGTLVASQVTLAWDPSASPSVAGYRLYYGASSRTYTNVIDLGGSISITVSNLVSETTYFFAVTAYDVVGLESDFSTEIAYTVPPLSPLLQIAADPIRGATLTGSGPVGASYTLLTSTNLADWTPLTNLTLDTTGTFRFVDPADMNVARRFYRLQKMDQASGSSSPSEATVWPSTN